MNTETQEEHRVIPEAETGVSCLKPRNAEDRWPAAEARRKVQKSIFSAQFNMLSKQRTLNKSGIHSFKVSRKKKPDQRTQGVMRALAPGKESCY